MLWLSTKNTQFKLKLIRFNSQKINTLKYFRNAENIKNSLKLNIINKLFNYIFADSIIILILSKKMFYTIIHQ